MHQSIPAAPCPPPPGLTPGNLLFFLWMAKSLNMIANVVGFKLFYHSSSIQEMKHVLRPTSRFLKFEARK